MKHGIPLAFKEIVLIFSGFIFAWYFMWTFVGVLVAAGDTSSDGGRKLNCSTFYKYELILPIAPVACWLKEEL